MKIFLEIKSQYEQKGTRLGYQIGLLWNFYSLESPLVIFKKLIKLFKNADFTYKFTTLIRFFIIPKFISSWSTYEVKGLNFHKRRTAFQLRFSQVNVSSLSFIRIPIYSLTFPSIYLRFTSMKTLCNDGKAAWRITTRFSY